MPADSEQPLLRRIRELAPCRDDAEARRALTSTLSVLSEQLYDEERAIVARVLPPELGAALERPRRPRAPGLRRFFRRVARREGLRLSLGVEHAEVVCRVLAETLPEPALEQLRRSAPELAHLFHVPEPEPPPPPVSHETPEPATPTPGPHRAHRHSVARSDNPHADTRLSSAHGLTQEREGRTLATGHPGSNRPISSGR